MATKHFLFFHKQQRQKNKHRRRIKSLGYPFRGSCHWGSRKQRNAPAFRVRPRTICAAGAAPPRRRRRRLTTLLKVASLASNRLKGVVRRRRRRTGPGESGDGAAFSRGGLREGEAARRNPWDMIFVQKIVSLSGACNASAPYFHFYFYPYASQ